MALSNQELFKERLSFLKETLTTATHPALPKVLADIRAAIEADPECVTIMTPEEIHDVVTGLATQKQIVITSTKAASGSKSLKKIAQEDDCI